MRLWCFLVHAAKLPNRLGFNCGSSLCPKKHSLPPAVDWLPMVRGRILSGIFFSFWKPDTILLIILKSLFYMNLSCGSTCCLGAQSYGSYLIPNRMYLGYAFSFCNRCIFMLIICTLWVGHHCALAYLGFIASWDV